MRQKLTALDLHEERPLTESVANNAHILPQHDRQSISHKLYAAARCLYSSNNAQNRSNTHHNVYLDVADIVAITASS